MRKDMYRTTASVLGAAAMLVTVGASAATGAPDTRLPAAELWCGEVQIAPEDWVALPQAGTLWVDEGDLAGHYVILESVHYAMDGLWAADEAPPASYDDDDFVPLGPPKARGTKSGLETMECTVISRFIMMNRTVFAPMTVAEVPAG